MNESAGDQIAEMLSTHLDLTEESLDSPEAVEDAPVARAREGLPRSFRMRHDAHYVDELMSRATDSQERERETTPSRTTTSVPAAGSGLAPIALIADRLESIVAHANAGRPQGAATFIEQSV